MEILELVRKKAREEIFHLDVITSGTWKVHQIFQSVHLSAARQLFFYPSVSSWFIAWWQITIINNLIAPGCSNCTFKSGIYVHFLLMFMLMASACVLTHHTVSKLLGKNKLHGLGALDLWCIKGCYFASSPKFFFGEWMSKRFMGLSFVKLWYLFESMSPKRSQMSCWHWGEMGTVPGGWAR